MKKLTAILLALCLLAAVCTALADTRIGIADTNMSLAVPDDLLEEELTDDEIEEGVFCLFLNEEDTLQLAVLAFEDQISIEELYDTLEAEKDYTSIGTTKIGDYVAIYEVIPADDDDGFFVYYWFSDEAGVVAIEFWCRDEEAAARTQTIMESLQ